MTTRDVVFGFLEAVRAGKAWEAFLSEELQFTNFTEPVKRVMGKEASVAGLRRFYAMVTTIEVGNILVDGHRACALTHYQLQPPGGAPFESHVAELFEVVDGKIAAFGIYFDSVPYPRPAMPTG
ncbi:MAG: nuclear transport factor 2 family protein [Gemmatimonadota bacterium]